MRTIEEARIAVIGLGYVGLSLAVEFGKRLPTLGYDTDEKRIRKLLSGCDVTLEVDAKELELASQLRFTSAPEEMRVCNVYIAAVQTPIDQYKHPDLTLLEAASRAIGKVIGRGDVAIFESTVYPGATEEFCVPIIESESGLKYNSDFFVGYSPERINTGDRDHRLPAIVKVTSGSAPEAADFVDELYSQIVSAGTYKASSIRVAEAAKVIENTQRDVNIALVNELAVIFEKLGIDTLEVLEAAGTKWNFLPFRPGLVGGHCIGIDPYYLAHKAQEIGYQPEMILAGRRINDSMGAYIGECVVSMMNQRDIPVQGSSILVMGLAFKENCPDLRNTRVVDVIRRLEGYHADVDVYDPWVDQEAASIEYGLRPIDDPCGPYDAVVIAVSHQQFAEMGVETVRGMCKPQAVVFDVKSLFPQSDSDGRL